MAIEAFPSRPLRLRVPAQGEPWLSLFLSALALAAVVFFLYLNGPDLLRDWRIREGSVPAKAARILEGRCRSKLFVHWCDARIEHRVGNETRTTNQSFLFFDLHLGSYRTSVRQSTTDASLVTTDLALDSFWNRVLTLGLFVVAFLIGAGAGLRKSLQEMAANRRFAHLDGAVLRPIPVDVFSAADLGKRGAAWHYGPAGAAQPMSFVRMPRKMRPFFMNDQSPRALAVTDGQGEPLLLDDGLSMLKLEREEYERLQAWRARQRGSVPSVGGSPIEQPA